MRLAVGAASPGIRDLPIGSRVLAFKASRILIAIITAIIRGPSSAPAGQRWDVASLREASGAGLGSGMDGSLRDSLTPHLSELLPFHCDTQVFPTAPCHFSSSF